MKLEKSSEARPSTNSNETVWVIVDYDIWMEVIDNGFSEFGLGVVAS